MEIIRTIAGPCQFGAISLYGAQTTEDWTFSIYRTRGADRDYLVYNYPAPAGDSFVFPGEYSLAEGISLVVEASAPIVVGVEA